MSQDETGAATPYVGRRRRDPKCQVYAPGCTGTGAEIYAPRLDGGQRIVVACDNCEADLLASI